nr:serine/threonine-protein kinase 19 [Nicotiana tomentosiformis]
MVAIVVEGKKILVVEKNRRAGGIFGHFLLQSCKPSPHIKKEKTMENTSPSTSRKRQRDDEPEPELELNDAQFLTLEENFNFSDTLVALRMMSAQFPRIEKVTIQPFILRSQLYSSLKDRTQVDRDLESLRRERVIRTFKLNTGQDDHAIMFLDDYFSQIDRVSKRLEAQKLEDISVFEWFKEHVIHSKLDPSIGHDELCSLLSLGGKVKEEHISLLINAGLLTRQLIDPNMYWFAIPNIGSVLKGLSQGRKELMSFLNRRKYKEMAMASLEKKRLRLSPLDMRFHLRDLLGSGHLKTVESPTGLVVKVVKD